MAVDVKLSQQYSLTFCCHATEMKECMKQRRVTEFLHAEKNGSHIHSSALVNVCGNKTVVHPSSGYSYSGSSLLGQVLRSVACRLLFIVGKKCTASGGDYVEK